MKLSPQYACTPYKALCLCACVHKITSLSSIFMQRQEGWFCGSDSDAGLETSGYYSYTLPL